MKTSAVQPWLSKLSWKTQTVLLSALRGCDGKEKEDYSKPFTRKFRSVVLFDAGASDVPNSFMHDSVGEENVVKFISNLDHYPMHWLIHFTHAIEIIGYYHPHPRIKDFWFTMYVNITHALHFNIETKAQLEERLEDGS